MHAQAYTHAYTQAYTPTYGVIMVSLDKSGSLLIFPLLFKTVPVASISTSCGGSVHEVSQVVPEVSEDWEMQDKAPGEEDTGIYTLSSREHLHHGQPTTLAGATNACGILCHLPIILTEL